MDIFVHLFLVLYWYLMKGVENCVNAKINLIHFHGDCLVFGFSKSKAHQKVEKHLDTWHVYSNP